MSIRKIRLIRGSSTEGDERNRHREVAVEEVDAIEVASAVCRDALASSLAGSLKSTIWTRTALSLSSGPCGLTVREARH